MLDLTNLSIYAVRNDLSDLYAVLATGLPPAVANAWSGARNSPSPVDAIVKGMEAAYGAMALSDDDAVRDRIAPVAAKAAQMVAENGWHGKVDRAMAIVNACRRALGEDVPGENPDVDPAVTPMTEPSSDA